MIKFQYQNELYRFFSQFIIYIHLSTLPSLYFSSYSMDINEIRNKYRSILEEDPILFPNNNNQNANDENQEELSEREWINIAKRQKQKRTLTESSKNKQNRYTDAKQHKKPTAYSKKPSSKLSTEQIIIDLKQKLAQSILNTNRKDAELLEFQNLILRKNEEIKLQQKTIAQLKKVIEDKDSAIFEQKIKQDGLEKQIKHRDNAIDELKIQNELLKKHIENYSKELEFINQRWKEEQKLIEKAERQKQKVDSFKHKIQKLKDDVKRLQFLLSDNQVYAPLLVSLEGKHFLGRPNKQSKELQYWYPESLIAGVEQFLKKEQIGYGNKAFSESLTKFIYGLLERSQKTGEKRSKHKFTSRIKQLERKKNHICNLIDGPFQIDPKAKSSRNSRLNASSLRKTTPLTGNCSRIKSRDFSVCLEKSLCFDRQTISSAKYAPNYQSKASTKKPFIIEGMQKSVRTNQNHKRHVVMELIESFCKGVEKLFKLENKTLAQEKISELCDWLKESIEEIYESSKLLGQDDVFKQTGKWKTVADC